MSVSLDAPLVLVGAGRMGGAMLAGWLERGVEKTLIEVQDPSPSAEVAALITDHGLGHNADVAAIGRASVVVLAVKPQMMEEVLPGLAPLVRANPVFLSIAAGRTIASFERHFGPKAAVVRAMPNTPAAIGRGITVACANTHASETQKALCGELLAAVGEVAWVEDEKLLDPVTAVSGSGPAYVFHLTECLAEAGVAAGLDKALAMRLARATVSGAGELMRRSELEVASLRENVTSPGGTTAAALAVLRDDNRLAALMREAVAAATKRAGELAA